MFGYDYGDRPHTTVFEPVEVVNVERVTYSSYYNMHVAADEDTDGRMMKVVTLT